MFSVMVVMSTTPDVANMTTAAGEQVEVKPVGETFPIPEAA